MSDIYDLLLQINDVFYKSHVHDNCNNNRQLS